MKLETERLNLIPLTKEDIPDIHRMHCFKDVIRYNTIGIPASLAVTEKFFEGYFEGLKAEAPAKVIWSIRDKITDEFYGEFGLSISPARYRRAEINYNLHPDYWGKGFAIESATRVLKYCFEDLKLHRIQAGAAPENVKSIAILKKLNMVYEGNNRAVLPTIDGWKDSNFFAILEDEYFNR